MNTMNLIGRTTADPELRYASGGTPVSALRLAVNVPPRGGQGAALMVDVTAEDERDVDENGS